MIDLKLKITSREIAATAICAAIYAIGSYLTAYIPSPTIVQLRPAVVVPAIFAVLMGPMVGGLGAAIGTFIASIFVYGTPSLTIFSGTPANFACFFLIGKFSRPYNLRNFAAGTVIGFLVGSFIIGFGLWFLAVYLGFLLPPTLLIKLPVTQLAVLTAIVWTLGTGVICTLLLGPLILKACFTSFPQLAPKMLEEEGEKVSEKPL